MTELAEIAASVARALGVTLAPEFEQPQWNLPGTIFMDGSNLFDPYWQVRCRDWLMEQGWIICFDWRPGRPHSIWKANPQFDIDCPASEFCARAIHELGKPK